jgi:hypothetical protein
MEAFQILSSSDLANCKCLGSTFFSDGRTILKTNIIQDCLGSLFLASSKLIKDNCKFKIADTKEKIFSLGNNTWLMYSVGTIVTNNVYPKTKNLYILTISSGTTSSLLMTLRTFRSTLPGWIGMDLEQLFEHHNSEEITNTINELRTKITANLMPVPFCNN